MFIIYLYGGYFFVLIFDYLVDVNGEGKRFIVVYGVIKFSVVGEVVSVVYFYFLVFSGVGVFFYYFIDVL